MSSTVRIHIVALLAACVVGCVDPERVTLSRVHSRQVSGEVRTAAGAPRAGISVTLTPVTPGFGHDTVGKCVGTSGSEKHLMADSNGQFEWTMTAGGPPWFGCIDVAVVPSPGASTIHVSRDSVLVGPGTTQPPVIFEVIIP